MYHHIRKVHIPNTKVYSQQLAKEGLLHADAYDTIRKEYFEELEHEYSKMKHLKEVNLKEFTDAQHKGPKAFTEQWKGMKPSQFGE